MSSLRLALKLSLQDNPDAGSTEKPTESFESLDTIVGRKRKGSLDKKEPRKRSREDSSSKSRSKNGDDSNKDGGSVAGDSFTSLGMHADEASVSSNTLNKDDEFQDDELPSSNNIGNESDSLKIKKENVDEIIYTEVPLSMETIDIKVESTTEDAVIPLATESEDKQDEVASPRKVASTKKRLLKGLDISEKEVADALLEKDGEEDVLRYQSNRAAAMAAKTKLQVTTATLGRISKIAPNSSETIVAPTAAPKESSRRGGWNRGGGRGARAGVPQQLVPIEWVQCEKCSKWRSVSPSVDIRSLPDVWVCADNTWDTENNHCEAPEQTEDEAKDMYSAQHFSTVGSPSLEPPRAKRETSEGTSGGSMVETPSHGGDGEEADNELLSGVKNRGSKRGRSSARGNRRGVAMGSDDSADEDADVPTTSSRANRRQVNYAEDDEEGGQLDRSGRMTQRRRSNGLSSRGSGRDLNSSFAAAAAVASVNWVQCNKCGKWRKVPESIDVNKLPDTWLCQMNTWNPSVARCSAREESDEPANDAGIGGAGGNAPAGGRASGRGGGGGASARSGTNSHTQAVIAAMMAANSAAMAAAANAPPLPPGEIRQIKWVQCERKNCKKWRKVPAYIDMDTFPEKWFCEMNFWSPERSSCDVTEDHDSEDERKKKEARNNRNLLLGSNKGGAQLSYRRIIYGTDAKVRPHFSEKSKLGNGIFTYPIPSRKHNEDDDDETNGHYNEGLEPVRRVSYWWSTAHDDRLHGLHAHCLPATFGSTTTSTNEPTTKSDTVKEEALTAPATLLLPLSSSSAKMNTDGTESKPQQVSYMMDTAHRLYQEASTAAGPWKLPNRHQDMRFIAAMEQINALTLYQRMTLENNAIRTLLQSTSDVHILFIRLMKLIATATFLNPVFEACRYVLVDQKSAVVDILHRLEEKSELEVGYTRDNQLVITLLPSLDVLRQELAARRGCFDAQVNGPLRARRYDPRQRKCFQQSSSSSNNNSSRASQLSSDAQPVNVKMMLEQLPFAEGTLRTVAAANNIPIRTTADGEFLWQFPASGPNAMVHSSAWTTAEVLAILPNIPPPLTAEEKQLITTAINAATGGAMVPVAASVASGGSSGGSSNPLASNQSNGGARGRSSGVTGGGGRGGGRGRGRNQSGIGPYGQERAIGGRGTKRAAKGTADTATAAVTTTVMTAGAIVLPLTEGAAASEGSTVAEGVGARKARRPYVRRKSPQESTQDMIDAHSAVSNAAVPIGDHASNLHLLSHSSHEYHATSASRDNDAPHVSSGPSLQQPVSSNISDSSSSNNNRSSNSSSIRHHRSTEGANNEEDENEGAGEVEDGEQGGKGRSSSNNNNKDDEDGDDEVVANEDEDRDNDDDDGDDGDGDSVDEADDVEDGNEDVDAEAAPSRKAESTSEKEAAMDVEQEVGEDAHTMDRRNEVGEAGIKSVDSKPSDDDDDDDDDEDLEQSNVENEDIGVNEINETLGSKGLEVDNDHVETVEASAPALLNEEQIAATNMEVDENSG